MNRHLNTLAILHTVYGVLVCFLGFFMLLFVMLGTFLQTDLVQMDSEPPPEWLAPFLQTFGVVLFFIIELWGVLIMLSGRWLKRRKNRVGSVVVAALCLLSFPIGTALGVFTLMVLTNKEVQDEYEGKPVAAIAA